MELKEWFNFFATSEISPAQVGGELAQKYALYGNAIRVLGLITQDPVEIEKQVEELMRRRGDA